MKVVIIAGGQGTRISSINADIPKAMIPIDGKPIIERQIELAKRYGFTDFIFIIGHLGKQISDYFDNGKRFGVNIEYYQETSPMGTAGALAYLKDKLTEDFFVFYGDTVMDIDMLHMLQYHKEHKADATLFVHPNDHPYDSDIIAIDNDHRVTAFYIKPHPENFISRNIVNASLFIFSPKIIDEIELGKKSHIEKDVLPRCLKKDMRLFGYLSAEYIKDMGTPDRYYAVTDDVRSGKVMRLNRSNTRPAIFLDRDGVINKEVNFLNTVDKMELIPGAADGIRYINEKGYLAIVVTNQPVIARGECTWEELSEINAKMETLLGKEHAYLNDIYICPHHPDSGFPGERKEYKIKCDCRKPAPGLLLRAEKDWNIDMSHSIMIGDQDRDVQAGENANIMKSIKIATNQPNALLDVLKILI
jgi:mannose-1-phosphate guanylyltransferase/phosphomannomutase